MKSLLHLISISILLSLGFGCQKDAVSPSEPEQEEVIPTEQYYPGFSTYTKQFSYSLNLHFNGSIYNVQNCFRYKLIPGVSVGDNYFYQITKQNVYQHCINDPFTELPAEAAEGYFRYSFIEKKAFYYSTLEDSNPKTLYDFNVNVNDTVLLAEATWPQWAFVVDEITTEIVDGIELPKHCGRIVHTNCSNCIDTPIIITPYAPNPYLLPFKELDYSYFWNQPFPTICTNYDAFTLSHFRISLLDENLEYVYLLEQ